MSGLFVTFEGGEGAGKTTQVRLLADALEAAGGIVVRTREPGGTAAGEEVRGLLVDGPPERWSPLGELYLLLAARQEHVERLIRPALARGQTVLCDRFHDSSRAYQGIAGGLGVATVDALHAPLLRGLEPDLTLLLDLPVETGLARRDSAGGGGRFEAKGTAFHARLRDGFLSLAATEPGRFTVIDADRPVEAVAADVLRAVLARGA